MTFKSDGVCFVSQMGSMTADGEWYYRAENGVLQFSYSKDIKNNVTAQYTYYVVKDGGEDYLILDGSIILHEHH